MYHIVPDTLLCRLVIPIDTRIKLDKWPHQIQVCLLDSEMHRCQSEVSRDHGALPDEAAVCVC